MCAFFRDVIQAVIRFQNINNNRSVKMNKMIKNLFLRKLQKKFIWILLLKCLLNFDWRCSSSLGLCEMILLLDIDNIAKRNNWREISHGFQYAPIWYVCLKGITSSIPFRSVHTIQKKTIQKELKKSCFSFFFESPFCVIVRTWAYPLPLVL